MDSVSCWASLHLCGGEPPLCLAVSLNGEPETAVANVTRQETHDALTLEVEPHTPMTYIEALRVGTNQLTRPDIRFSALTNAGKLTRLDVSFRGLRSEDMQVFRPFGWLWWPVEADASVSPRWVVDRPVFGETGRLCDWEDLFVSGAMRWTSELSAVLSRGEAASVDLSGVPAWVSGLPASAHMIRPRADVNGVARTTREIPVSIHPSGGVVYGWVGYLPMWSVFLPVEGSSGGDPMIAVTSRTRRSDVAEAEVVLEVK
ncbi:hypothetical protein L2W58_00205 [Dethiosulfovibrio sp. F2B]|uniref:hypothetical protein n=1 Tax=Dethiosulfovibrio faecalis TaxID=2720018 RepID=UPI001F33AECB|nr:hypothetical protein [Dethiosulfovibrio faecalis]MCF4150230.1 hypothetical protein [Dethiosulfovibrio faecalis]